MHSRQVASLVHASVSSVQSEIVVSSVSLVDVPVAVTEVVVAFAQGTTFVIEASKAIDAKRYRRVFFAVALATLPVVDVVPKAICVM